MAAGQRMTENTGEKAEGREREAWWEIMTSGFWDVLLTHTTLQLPTPGAQAGLSSMSSRPTATSTVVCHVAGSCTWSDGKVRLWLRVGPQLCRSFQRWLVGLLLTTTT